MSHWLLTHQPVLIAVIVLNGLSICVLVAGMAYRPKIKRRAP